MSLAKDVSELVQNVVNRNLRKAVRPWRWRFIDLSGEEFYDRKKQADADAKFYDFWPQVRIEFTFTTSQHEDVKLIATINMAKKPAITLQRFIDQMTPTVEFMADYQIRQRKAAELAALAKTQIQVNAELEARPFDNA